MYEDPSEHHTGNGDYYIKSTHERVRSGVQYVLHRERESGIWRVGMRVALDLREALAFLRERTHLVLRLENGGYQEFHVAGIGPRGEVFVSVDGHLREEW